MAKHPITKHVQEQVDKQWGGRMARENLGDVLYEKALNSALLTHLDMQDESVDPARLVEVLRAVRAEIIDMMYDDQSPPTIWVDTESGIYGSFESLRLITPDASTLDAWNHGKWSDREIANYAVEQSEQQ